MHRFVIPCDGDTCTLTLRGDIARLVASFAGVKVSEYTFVERSDNLELPLVINLVAFKGHEFVVECCGEGVVTTNFTLYDDLEYRRWLSTQPVFRHGSGAYVMKDTGHVCQKPRQENLVGFDRVVHPGVHGPNSVRLQRFGEVYRVEVPMGEPTVSYERSEAVHLERGPREPRHDGYGDSSDVLVYE